MRAREFAFWLQGYFELDGGTEPLTSRQAKQIQSKIEKVDMTGNDDADQKAAAYVQFANGALSSVYYLPESDHAALLSGVTAKLRKDLNDLFVHAIDPSMPGDQQQHRSAHRPGGNRGGVEVLC